MGACIGATIPSSSAPSPSRPGIALGLVIVVMGLVAGCGGPAPLIVNMPLHLEEHLDAATIVGSEVPEDIPEPVEWHFDAPQPDWNPIVPMNPSTKPVKVDRTADALRLTLDESNDNLQGALWGGIVIDLPQWSGREWSSVLVRARASERIQGMGVGFNTTSRELGTSTAPDPFAFQSQSADVINDGTVQTYLLAPTRGERSRWEGNWSQLGLWVGASGPATLDILSVSVVPIEGLYADAKAGSTMGGGELARRMLYMHTPGQL